MKKRGIKQQVKEAEKTILSDDKEWFNAFMSENYPDYGRQKAKKPIPALRRRPVFTTLVSCVSVAVVIISLIFLWQGKFPATDNNQPRKSYEIKNEAHVDSDITELNSDLQGIIVAIDTAYELKNFDRIYDSVYNDNLYYKIEIEEYEEFFEKINIFVYVNPDYKNRKGIFGSEIKTDKSSDFTISYNENINDDDGLFTLKYFAFMEYGDMAVYIEYEQLSLDDQSNFFNFFAQAFKQV